jgi:indoleamine 2,3-dioxygenase
MSSAETLFPYLRKDPSDLPEGADPFTITTRNGYLPFNLPLRTLPSAFDALTEILHQMPIVKEDGNAGLLATFELGPLIDNGALPDLTHEIDRLLIPGTDKRDMAAVTAAFRDYSFVASSYLLEPCWETYSADKDNGYGLGRQVLPICIAGPLTKCAEM